MKLIKVEYLEECSKCFFFNVTIEIKPLFRKSFQVTRKAYLKKWKTNNGYDISYYWSDTGKYGCLIENVVAEMILQYEKHKNK